MDVPHGNPLNGRVATAEKEGPEAGINAEVEKARPKKSSAADIRAEDRAASGHWEEAWSSAATTSRSPHWSSARSKSLWPPTSRSTSAIHRVLGNAEAPGARMDCSGSPCQEASTFRATAQLQLNAIARQLNERRLLTLCVHFDPTPAARRAARSLAATFVTAACSFEQPSDGPQSGIEAVRLLRPVPPAVVSLVVALPDEHDPGVDRQVGEMLDYLRTRSGHTLHAAVVVAASPSKWASCTFDGFVKANPQGGVADALAMFNMLAAIMAPDYLCPFDAYDILSCVGSATEPSSQHSATFFPGSGDAVPDSANAGTSLRTCAAMEHSQKLGRNLRKVNPNTTRPLETDARHVVASEASGARVSRVLSTIGFCSSAGSGTRC